MSCPSHVYARCEAQENKDCALRRLTHFPVSDAAARVLIGLLQGVRCTCGTTLELFFQSAETPPT